jgi:microcompartment protein CcmL/EutN
MPEPALAVLELASLARGVVAVDALLKKASVRVALNEPVSPGKYLVVAVGEVAELAEAFDEGVRVAGATLLDSLYLPYVHPSVLAATFELRAQRSAQAALGIIEMQTVASTLKGADIALKSAAVRLTQMQLARGIGGKAWFTVEGHQHDVEAALEAVAQVIGPPLLLATELIAAPHTELRH